MPAHIDNKTYRNIQEQVLKNAIDIETLKETNDVLSRLGIIVVGSVESPDQLPDPQTYQGNYGDGYTVGTVTPYDYYIFTRPFEGEQYPQWFNIGKFPAPSTVPGPQGETGPAGEQGTRGIGFTSGYGNPAITGDELKGDLYLDYNSGYIFEFMAGRFWQRKVSIMGSQGIQGPTGPQGQTGPQGPKGDKGDTGDVGGFINIVGTLADPSLLPTPASLGNLTMAYLVGNDRHLYIQVGSTSATAVWMDMGVLNVATYVTVSGQYQNTWDADTKLDKITTGGSNRVYAVDANGNQITYQVIGGAAAPYTLLQRDANGRIQAGYNPRNVGALADDYGLTGKSLRKAASIGDSRTTVELSSDTAYLASGSQFSGRIRINFKVSTFGDTNPEWQMTFVAGEDLILDGIDAGIAWAFEAPSFVPGNIYTIVFYPIFAEEVVGIQPGGYFTGTMGAVVLEYA